MISGVNVNLNRFKNLFLIICLFLSAAMLVCAIAPPASHAAEDKNILILNSYHHGYQWTDDQTSGIIEGLQPVKENSRLYIEYMGAKWAYGDSYFKQLSDIYKSKFHNTHFDLIIATDNDALNFLVTHRNKTFGKIPVVFCGANWFQKQELHGERLYTGVNEDADYAANLDLMLRLHPETRQVYIVADMTTTGIIMHEKLREIAPRYKDRIKIHLLDDIEMPAMLKTVSQLGNDSLVLLTTYQKDKAGVFYDAGDVAMLLSKASPVPVYAMWDFSFNHGVIGGMLTSGHAQGSSAGALALRILKGESPDSIPVIMESPNRFMFDYKQLKRFNMLDAKLPEGSKIINQPPTFYALNKGLFWGMVIGITGLTVALIGQIFYIYYRRQAETRLRVSEERYHSLVDNLTLGIYRIKIEGIFIQANPAMARIFGYNAPEELLKISISDLYNNPAERTMVLEDIVHNGFVKNREVLMRRKSGEPVWVSINAMVKRDELGRLLWIDGIFEDINDKKQLETQLLHSQKMEAIGTMAGGVAHDFNNILTAIMGYGNLLKMKTPPDNPNINYLVSLLAAADKAAQLTKSLLAFSRKQVINLKPCELNDIVEGMIKMLHRLIDDDFQLTFSLHSSPLPIQADHGQIEQVLLNLVTNARDSMPNGGLICVSTDRVTLDREFIIKHDMDTAGEYSVLSVSDNGIGMPKEIIQRIFEPFFSTKEVGRGTGLGLSIVYGIVKQHKGDISVYSEIDKGTTFRIYLPIARHLDQELKSVTAVSTTGGTETILVAEDNNEVRSLIREILECGGYTVILTRDGEDAVNKYRQHASEIDMVLLDVVMPRKNGKEAYEAIKLINPHISVLFMSGYTADIIHQKGILEEGVYFISKPISPDILLSKIREVLVSKHSN